MYEVQLAFGYWLAGVIPHAPGTIERVIGTLRHSQCRIGIQLCLVPSTSQ